SGLERLVRKLPFEKAGGCIFLSPVFLFVVGIVFAALYLGGFFPSPFLVFTLLALRNLDPEFPKVLTPLQVGDLRAAPTLVGYLVGRDTKDLSERDVTRAVFETVAENMSDAVVAPLFYLAVLGVPGMVAYKAVNTMDSMLGYKNERYIRFGWAAARLDDVANYIPARITAGLIVLSAEFLRLRWRAAVIAVFSDAHL